MLAVAVLTELARSKYVALFGLTCIAPAVACMTSLGGSGSRLIGPVGEYVRSIYYPVYRQNSCSVSLGRLRFLSFLMSLHGKYIVGWLTRYVTTSIH
jgi:hypothetical protein